MTSTLRFPAAGLALAASAVLAAAAQAQTFPMKPIRIVAPVPPGGSVDTVARVIAPRMAEILGQQVVIDNRPGASTNIGTELVARAPADGYTLLANAVPFAANPSFFPKLAFEPLRDFAPISLVATTPHVLVAHPSLPVKDVPGLVALATKRPGEIKYSSAGAGTNLHIAAELLKYLTRTDVVHVPYKGGGPALLALLGGEVETSFPALVAAMGQIGAGRLRALGVTSATRAQSLPQLPTIAEQGVPGYEFTSWVGLLAPAGTPPQVLATLHEAIVKATQAPGMRERFDREGAEVVVSSPADFRKFLVADVARWAKLIKESGMKAE